MNSENSKTSELLWLVLHLIDKIDLINNRVINIVVCCIINNVVLSNLSIYTIQKTLRIHIKIICLKY